MSLINQMLKDLQEQENGKSPVPGSLQSGTKKRNISCSSPLILVCAGTILLGLTWWAGSVLFQPTPRQEPVEQRQIEKPAPAAMPVTVAMANPVQATVPAQEVVPAKPPIIEPVQPAAARDEEPPASLAATVVAKQSKSMTYEPVKVAAKVSPPPPLPAQQTAKIESKPATAMSRPVEVIPPTTPRREAAVAARPLSPEKLPGAIQSSARNQAVNQETTPLGSSYKLAEQAYQEGKRALEGANREMGVKSLQQALQLYAGHMPARELLAETYDKAGRDREAMVLLDEGLKIAPDYIGFKKIQARILADEGDLNGAITLMMRGGLPSIKTDPEAHEFLATLYQRLGESYLAAQTYRNLLAISPQNGNYWFGLGDVLDKQGLRDEAAGCYRTALETGTLRQNLREQAKSRLSSLGQGPPA